VVTDLMSECEAKMHRVLESLKRDLAGVRTGRASPALVDKVQVDYYGVPTPLNQIANVTVPEPRLIVIQPYEKTMMAGIEKAIQKSDLGLTPSNDGRVIRLKIPELTEERRRDLVKVARRRIEEGRVSVRNVRRDSQEDLKDYEKEKLISEDEFKRGHERLQKLTDAMIVEVDRIGAKKEEEIMEV
jgi:ribosome recycling factor